VRVDPFRIQFLTVSLDSQVALTLVGLIVAGLLVGKAARQTGVGLGAGRWWDLVFAGVVGARLVWVATHANYFLRQPLQIVVIQDGGLSAVGAALAGVYWVWRFCRADDAPDWRRTVDLLAVGVLTACLFERVGCALTTCGSGPLSAQPWAMLRGDAWHTPLALAQVIALAAALTIAVETLRRPGAAFLTLLASLGLGELIAVAAGRGSVESALALAIIAGSYGAARSLARPRSRPASA